MKKISIAIVAAFFLLVNVPSIAFSATPSISVVVNNSKLNFPDAKPFIDAKGRTLTPASYIARALGATVEWVKEEKKAIFTYEDKTVILYDGKKDYEADGAIKQMDTTALVKSGRIYVPVKYIAEEFGANVKWNEVTKTVYISRTLAQAVEGKDVPANTVINNKNELKEVIKIASYTLQPEIILLCNNFTEDEYSLEGIDIYGLTSIGYSGEYTKDMVCLKVKLSYNQAHRIEQSSINKLALKRITEEDARVIKKIEEIIPLIIKDGMTGYQKEIAVHNYLVENCKYDADNYEKNTIPDKSYEPYGLLIDGIGVCQAYADTTKLMLNKAGIECEVVVGTSKDDSHAWNLVKLEGEYYMIDTTWDDPVPDEKGHLNYAYFNLTSEQLAQDHEWDKSKWPTASGTKYNYFVYNNLVANNYNEFKQLVIGEILKGKKEISVYINGYNDSEYDMSFIRDFYSDSYSYSVPGMVNTAITIRLSE